MNQVGDVKSPKEGRKTTTFRESFVDVNVGVVVSESVENTVHEGVMEGAYALPEVRWDVIVMQTDLCLFTPKKFLLPRPENGQTSRSKEDFSK